MALSFDIPFLQCINENGELVTALPDCIKDASDLVPLYEAMVLTRFFDEKAVALQRTGRLGTFASSLGQEAVSIGIGSAMTAQDVLLPSFREQGAQIWRGVKMSELFAFWGGDERGSQFANVSEDFPICIPVASQFPHAVGVALAIKLKGERRAAVAVGGDGATSKGDFYEALNVCGVWSLPAVFVINNNQWAISMPRAEQSAAESLAQKAIAAGIPGVQVDGNDVIAVRWAVQDALKRAYEGEGATLIEAITYRLSDHTTSDDARRYREEAEVSAHWEREPVKRLRDYLVGQNIWTKEEEQGLVKACRDKVEQAAQDYLATPPQSPDDIFRYVFSELPQQMETQHTEFQRELAKDEGKDHA